MAVTFDYCRWWSCAAEPFLWLRTQQWKRELDTWHAVSEAVSRQALSGRSEETTWHLVKGYSPSCTTWSLHQSSHMYIRCDLTKTICLPDESETPKHTTWYLHQSPDMSSQQTPYAMHGKDSLLSTAQRLPTGVRSVHVGHVPSCLMHESSSLWIARLLFFSLHRGFSRMKSVYSCETQRIRPISFQWKLHSTPAQKQGARESQYTEFVVQILTVVVSKEFSIARESWPL